MPGTQIARKQAIDLIKRSSVVQEKSPRRKRKAVTVYDKIYRQLDILQTVEPSGEASYMNAYESEVSTGLLNAITSKHPNAVWNDKYSKEIITFELCQMAMQRHGLHKGENE